MCNYLINIAVLLSEQLDERRFEIPLALPGRAQYNPDIIGRSNEPC